VHFLTISEKNKKKIKRKNERGKEVRKKDEIGNRGEREKP
jgi:hypothetical protein